MYRDTFVARLTRCLVAAAFAGSLSTLPAWADKKVHKPTDGREETGDRAYDRIVKEVHHELVMLPFLSVFDDLSFSVEGGTVTLMGSTSRPVLKSDAENVVKRIEGVSQVVNKIEVLPLSPMDDRIRVAVARVVFGHSALNRYAMMAVPSIHIIVKNGNVTLEGVVASEMDKNIAGVEANSVPGVFSVKNNLRVEGKK